MAESAYVLEEQAIKQHAVQYDPFLFKILLSEIVDWSTAKVAEHTARFVPTSKSHTTAKAVRTLMLLQFIVSNYGMQTRERSVYSLGGSTLSTVCGDLLRLFVRQTFSRQNLNRDG